MSLLANDNTKLDPVRGRTASRNANGRDLARVTASRIRLHGVSSRATVATADMSSMHLSQAAKLQTHVEICAKYVTGPLDLFVVSGATSSRL